MDYKAKECAVCGSDKIKLISHKNDGENIFYTYRCEACGEVFSSRKRGCTASGKTSKRSRLKVGKRRRNRAGKQRAAFRNRNFQEEQKICG